MDRKGISGINRRDFLKTAGVTSALTAVSSTWLTTFAETTTASDLIKMMGLPYKVDALEPYLSKNTVNRHYNNHHKSYFRRLHMYLETNPKYGKFTLEQLITKTKGGILIEDALFNIAILLWDHNYYFQSMKPKGGIRPVKESVLTQRVVSDFGSIENFKNTFIARSMEIGLGWVWLLKVNNGVKIVRTSYHDGPIPSYYQPLFNIDLWEHAYYLDYGHDRKKYVESFLDHLVNWEFAEKRFLDNSTGNKLILNY